MILSRTALHRTHIPTIALTVLLVSYPMLELNLRGSANGVLFFFCLLGLFRLSTLGEARLPSARTPSLQTIAYLLCLPLLATAANELARHIWLPKNFDLPLRFALLGPCVAAATLLKKKHFKLMQWGFIIGALISLARLAYINRGGVRAGQIGFLNAIPFGDISLLLGFLSLLSLGWSLSGRRAEVAAKIIGFAAGLLASLISGSRGGWVAIPALLVLSWLALRQPQRRRSAGEHLARATGSVFLIAVALHFMWARIGLAVAEVLSFLHGARLETSVGIRFEIWRTSLMMFRDAPWFGIGRDAFIPKIAEYAQAGQVPATLIGLPHSHNELLFAISTGGLAGLIAMLLVYALPFSYFVRGLLKASSIETRCAAGMGACVVAGYFFFGLTETLFIMSMNTAIYVFTVAVLLAFVHACGIADRQANSPSAAQN